jgi:hypothetical protein
LCPPTWPSGTIICTSLNLHYIRKLSCNSELLWLSSSQGKKNQWLCQFFCIFMITSPSEEDLALYLNNLEFPLPKSDLYQVWLILACWFWRRRFLNDSTPFLHFWDYLPFEEDLALYLNNLEFPLPKDDLYPVWLKMACWFWRRRFFFNINICKYGFPYCGPSRPPGTMMWTILNLHYIRKLSCKEVEAPRAKIGPSS